MRITNLLIFFIVLAIMGSCSENSNKHINKEVLISSINQFNHAFSEGNIVKLSAMITDHYKHTNGSSKVIDGKSWISYLKKRNKDLQSGDLLVHNYDMDQVEISLYNTTAIVTGRIRTSTTKKGIFSKNEYRVTHLWVYENDQWKRAGFHDGKIK